MYVLNPVMITQSGKGYGQQLLPSYFLSFTCCHCCYQSDFKEASQASPDATVAVVIHCAVRLLLDGGATGGGGAAGRGGGASAAAAANTTASLKHRCWSLVVPQKYKLTFTIHVDSAQTSEANNVAAASLG